jgi:hypothetical protein
MGTSIGTSYPRLLINDTLQRRARSSFANFKPKLPGKGIQGQKHSVGHPAYGQWKLDISCKFFSRWSLFSPKDFRQKVPFKRRVGIFSSAVPEEEASSIGLKADQELQVPVEDMVKDNIVSSKHEELHQRNFFDGKPGFVAFGGGNHQHLKEGEFSSTSSEEGNRSLIWLLGPIALVASVVLPPFYLRKSFEAVFGDSLPTDFLILFFTEALFYSGTAVFLLVADYMQRPFFQFLPDKHSFVNRLHGYRVVSIATLVLSVLLPLVCLGLVWPWTGPAASAAIAPYLGGLIVQFAFEQYVQHKKSPVWPLVPVVFQVYRLHQLNRSAQLVASLMLSIRGAETTPQTMAINGALQTMLNFLQLLGIICLWSMATFIIRLFPSQPEAMLH